LKQTALLFILIITSAFSAQARKVTIVGEGMIKLVNPTAAGVNFNISCKDKTGATSVTATTDSIDAGKSKVYGVQVSAGPCVPSHNANSVFSDPSGYVNGMVKCAKTAAMYIDASAARGLCASGYRMCTMPEFLANKGSASTLRGMVSAATFSASTDSGTTWTDKSNTNDEYLYINDMMSSYRCSTGSNGSGSVHIGCESRMGTSGVEQTYCCPMIVVDQCTVEITSPAGHLISPQFKGGSPF
jgi:hypothetical protein